MNEYSQSELANLVAPEQFFWLRACKHVTCFKTRDLSATVTYVISASQFRNRWHACGCYSHAMDEHA